MQVQNESGLKPLGRAVLVRMIELEEMKTTLIAIPEHVRKNSSVMEQRAIVVEIGPSCWEDEKEQRAQPGDKVLLTKMAGYVARGADGQIYRLVNDRDIFAQITEEPSNG